MFNIQWVKFGEVENAKVQNRKTEMYRSKKKWCESRISVSIHSVADTWSYQSENEFLPL